MHKLLAMQQEVEQAIERERKQIERLQFVLEKAKQDAAYYKTLSTMMEDQNE